MGTVIRSKISEKNQYWVDRNRYHELRHFCLQYPTWKKAYLSIDGFKNNHADLASFIKTNIHSDMTAKAGEALKYYSDRMEMIEKAAKEASPDLDVYILKAVINGYSYTHLRMNTDIPCSRDVYYTAYRRFFWILNKLRE